MIYVLTGPVGSGKSLMATQRLIHYASQGRRVAANFHVDFAELAVRRYSKLSRSSCTILPAVVSALDLESLGVGGPSEDQAGLIVIDEAGTFLNSRTWSEEGRQKIIRWMLLSRKRRWDMILIVQAVSILDKQIRDAVVEVTGRIRRTDRIKVPGTGISLPRMHIANMRYGTNPTDATIERWWSRGDDAFKCYDTTALFDVGMAPTSSRVDHVPVSESYCVLPASLSKWRYKPLTRPERLIRWVRILRGLEPAVTPVRRPSVPKYRFPDVLDKDRQWRLARHLASLPQDRAQRVYEALLAKLSPVDQQPA